MMTYGGGGDCGPLGAPVHPVSEAVPHGSTDGDSDAGTLPGADSVTADRTTRKASKFSENTD